MPAGFTGLARAAWADLDGHGVEVAAVRGALDTKGIPIEGPAARFEIEGRAVKGIEPAVGRAAFRAGVPEGQGDGLTVDSLCYGCVCHWNHLSFGNEPAGGPNLWPVRFV